MTRGSARSQRRRAGVACVPSSLPAVCVASFHDPVVDRISRHEPAPCFEQLSSASAIGSSPPSAHDHAPSDDTANARLGCWFEETAVAFTAGFVDIRHRVDRVDRRIAARLRLVRARDRVAHRRRQIQLREERVDGHHGHAVAIDDQPVRVVQRPKSMNRACVPCETYASCICATASTPSRCRRSATARRVRTVLVERVDEVFCQPSQRSSAARRRS